MRIEAVVVWSWIDLKPKRPANSAHTIRGPNANTTSMGFYETQNVLKKHACTEIWDSEYYRRIFGIIFRLYRVVDNPIFNDRLTGAPQLIPYLELQFVEHIVMPEDLINLFPSQTLVVLVLYGATTADFFCCLKSFGFFETRNVLTGPASTYLWMGEQLPYYGKVSSPSKLCF